MKKKCPKVNHREYMRLYYLKPGNKEAKREYDRTHLENRRLRYQHRKRWINKFKDVPCKDCGIKYNPWVMQFDHLSNKKFIISSHTWKSKNVLLEEIAKCEIRCANCHLEKTF